MAIVVHIAASITFVTNKTTYGPFGKARINSWDCMHSFNCSLGSEVCWFSGFYGTVYNDYIESIGVYMTPATTQSQSSRHVKLECKN